MNYAAVAVLGLAPLTGISAEDPPRPTCDVAGAPALAECLTAALKVQETHLKAIYALITRMLDSGEIRPGAFFDDKKRDLMASERAWLRFRQAQCTAEVSMLTQPSASGEVQVSGDCMLRMTRERCSYLERVATSLAPDAKLCEKDVHACQAPGVSEFALEFSTMRWVDSQGDIPALESIG